MEKIIGKDLDCIPESQLSSSWIHFSYCGKRSKHLAPTDYLKHTNKTPILQYISFIIDPPDDNLTKKK